MISFEIMFANSTHELHSHNQICVGVRSDPGKLIALQLQKSFFNCKINVRTGFLDPKNMGKGITIDFLSQILRKLWGIEYLAHLAQNVISFFCIYDRKVAQGC